jgi:hypothetical protein
VTGWPTGRRLKVHTAQEGLKIQEIVGRALEAYLAQADKKVSLLGKKLSPRGTCLCYVFRLG